MKGVTARDAATAAGVEVTEAREVDRELTEAWGRLTPQLSSSSPSPSEAELAVIVGSRSTVMFMARDTRSDDAGLIGSLTLALFRIPTGLRAWIEDVVVDESVRGRGVGVALSVAAIERADAAGARTVDLTSRPSREAANRLYRRLGFVERETNVYRYSLD